ncbi:MAG: EI24 domain-containing protein [Cypionkella sp.]|uniref:EI24 domain-containing protein n=1 Tax=Cypionkella sp. TaxID=2811411 RepID=UPI002AB9D097|nr:EI24 domain-containing protein [Cypionkella sp.]MDZ4311180.1 EI24 domain-containing protein [Cypionkella sp.]MDZ4395584.1 EI24 domain-containing protein [Cypionkella sp.]
MIFSDFAKALSQLGDGRFMRVMLLGVALAAALLTGAYAALLWVIETFTPGSIDIPFVGPVGGLDTLLSWGSILLMAVLSVFLMIPVASAFSGLFLEDVAQAVEDQHYPSLPPVARPRFGDTLIDTANFIGLLLALNTLALLLYPFVGPFSPLLFWGMNGYLLGREYFTLVATRRLGREGARAMRKAYSLRIWMAGVLMAAPLSIPLINLAIPVLGVATFTHMFHRLSRQ